jgi:hypothetical protein
MGQIKKKVVIHEESNEFYTTKQGKLTNGRITNNEKVKLVTDSA